MSFADAAAAATLDVFEAHAGPAWIDVNGVAVEVRALRLAPSEELEFGTRRTTSQTVTLRMLASEVAPDGLASAIVADGAAITLETGEKRIAQGAPQWGDDQRLTVTVDTRSAP